MVGRYRAVTRALVGALLALSLAGCKNGKKEARSPAEEAEAVAKEEEEKEKEVATPGDPTAVLFEAAGYDGAIGVAIWPAHWDEIGASLGAALELFPPELRPRLKELVLDDWAEDVLEMAGLGARALEMPESVEGLDPERPIVASLMEPIGSFEALGLSAARHLSEGEPIDPAGFYHRILLPAEDPEALAEALTGTLAGDLEEMEDAGDAMVFGDDDLLLRITKAKVWVGIELVAGDRLDELEPARLDGLASETRSSDPVDELFAAASPSALRVQIRHDLLARFGPYTGMRLVARALRAADTDLRPRLFLAGYGEVLSQYALLDPAGAVSSDTLLEAPADQAGSLHLAIALTEKGAAALAADEKLGASGAVRFAEIDWKAVVEEAPAPRFLEKGSSRAVSQLFHECGTVCKLHALGGNALSLAHLTEELGEAELDQITGVIPATFNPSLSLSGGLLSVQVSGEGTSRFRSADLPAGAVSTGKADGCYRRALLALRKHFKLASSRRGDEEKKLAALPEEVKENLACAAKGESTKEKVERIRSTLEHLEQADAARR